MINFTASVARFLDIGLNDSLIGLILFGRKADIHFNVRQYLDQDSLVEAITGTAYNESIGTRTWLALDLLRESSLPNGAMMLREGFPHIAIVITDGRSQNHTLTNIAAQQLHEANIFDQIFAVGIGRGRRISRSELGQIASDPSLAYFLNDFEQSLFIELQQNLSQRVCNICKLIITHNVCICCYYYKCFNLTRLIFAYIATYLFTHISMYIFI